MDEILRTYASERLIAGTLTVFFALLLALCGGGGGTPNTPPTDCDQDWE